jgi:hypothetical protein
LPRYRSHSLPSGLTAALVSLSLSFPGYAAAQAPQPEKPPTTGWHTDYIGPLRGDVTLSLGAQFWKDYFKFRNLIGRATLDLAPGIRAHAVGRRREGSWNRMPFRPDIDEAYLEALAFYRHPEVQLGLNLKGGRVRYLRFPYPDDLAVFDQVPGIRDLYGGPVTDYRGALFTADVAHRSGLGFHFTSIQWGFDADQRGANAVEWYGFFRRGLGSGFRVEARAGALANRPEPLGRSAKRGASLFVGKQIGEFDVGAMIERRRGDRTYTGIMVRFRPTDITRFLGAIGFDYARSPEGFAVQKDFYHARLGQQTRPAPPNEELVGEVTAVRLRTYWQQSFQRNEYEHRISSWGETGRAGDRVVAVEEPWRLELEALVSPHVGIRREWLRDRQGPAQLAQDVVYKFYRKKR